MQTCSEPCGGSQTKALLFDDKAGAYEGGRGYGQGKTLGLVRRPYLRRRVTQAAGEIQPASLSVAVWQS